jgi:subtilisin family serine protease
MYCSARRSKARTTPSHMEQSFVIYLFRLGAVCCVCLLAACGGGGSSTPPAPPVATASSNVTSGQAPLQVSFDASRSSDPQGLALTYSWSFSDGGSATGATVSHTFQNHGAYTATVVVSDGPNTSTASPIQITVSAAPPAVQPKSISVNVLGIAPTAVQDTVVATDRESLILTYSITTPPNSGSATINANSGAVTYTVPGFTTSASDSFVVSVTNGSATSTATVSVALNGDPLLTTQWHIQNLGQSAFATTLPIAGVDLNVAGAWAAGFSGKGIKVGVVDSGLEAAHEDLAANVDLSHSYNFLTNTNDPTPQVLGEDHGTQVSGIIGAIAFNGKGGRGVAYNATLRGYNLLASGAFSAANMAKAMGSDPVSSDNDVFNASFGAWGPAGPTALPSFSGAYQSITLNAMNLRGGLGAAIVNAAGNEFVDFQSSVGSCTYAQTYGVSCGDPATDERRGGGYPLIVGALDATGVHASYSTTGSSLWISAPGGEYGFNSGYVPPALFAMLPDPTHDLMPAITTTAHSGCSNALNPFNQASPVPLNALDDLGANALAATCQYTAMMNGTSSATPNTSAVVAMMLEANPNLSVRDIKYILAKTAKRVDAGFTGISSTAIISGSTVVLEQGWVTNGAGYTFSNRYGFGAVDAAAAVSAAKAYTTYLPAVKNSTGNYTFVAAAPGTVPPHSTTGGYINFTVSESFQTVEYAVVFVNIASTPSMVCNQIELTSPSGTKSILMHAANGFTNAQVANTRFESNAFYGEPVNGTWVLRFLDFCAASGTSTTLSTTQPQTLLLAGH